ncbi:hypothetical protein HDE78_003589 [Rhodanobacter sp. K2T2]|uniref:hypothetical protein n=1 Tax=Rhodanobacter sp. K2T2 TaxID=2723085 RepID=UPI0015C8715E|nr:hypothetical protein [Rhodanobacter sp. K2T2]NYE30614.1 hypothetical protein [Rhodanobacter sp. K2T2]
MGMLQGCTSPVAPSPTPNPHPQQTLKLKITVEKNSLVNRVEVLTSWVVTNLSCAPIGYPAGNRVIKQVDVPEQVEKVGDYYVATIVKDRYLSDKCRWVGGGADVRFMHDDYLLSADGVNSDVMRGERDDVVTCLTRPFVNAGACGLRDEEKLYKSEDKHAFNATVELIK